MRADISLRESVVIIGTLPCVSVTSLNQDAFMEENVSSDMLTLRRSPAKVEEKWCERISCLGKKVFSIGLCVLRFSSEKICSAERTKIGIKSRPSRGVIQKCERHERNPYAPSLKRGHKTKPERCARRVAWNLAKNVFEKATFQSPRRRPLQHFQRNENSRLTPEHRCTCSAKRF